MKSGNLCRSTASRLLTKKRAKKDFFSLDSYSVMRKNDALCFPFSGFQPANPAKISLIGSTHPANERFFSKAGPEEHQIRRKKNPIACQAEGGALSSPPLPLIRHFKSPSVQEVASHSM